jgi:hypothetical protein
MMNSIPVFASTMSAGLWAAVLAAFLLVAANAVVVFLVVRLPAEFFCTPRARPRRPERHWLLHWVLLVGKNLLGGLMVLAGVLLTLPGVPGPGLVLILLGAMLIDFPGKRRLTRNLVRRKSIHGTINWVRARFGKPPLVLPKPPVRRRARFLENSPASVESK